VPRHVHLRCVRSLLRRHSRRKDRGRRPGRARPFPPARRTHIGSRGPARVMHDSPPPASSFPFPHQPLSEQNRSKNNSRTLSWTVWRREILSSFFRANHLEAPNPAPGGGFVFSSPANRRRRAAGPQRFRFLFSRPTTTGRQHCTKALALFFQVRSTAGSQPRNRKVSLCFFKSDPSPTGSIAPQLPRPAHQAPGSRSIPVRQKRNDNSVIVAPSSVRCYR
jgi:hypothetical protein